MRWKDEDIRCSQRAPFYVSRYEPCPSYTSIDSKFLSLLDQSLLPADFIWSRYEQVGTIHFARDTGKRFEEQITTLREMNPAEESYQLFAFQFRKPPKEQSQLLIGTPTRRCGSIIHQCLPALIRPKRSTSQKPFMFANEKHGFRVTKHPILDGNPVDDFS